MKSKNIVVGCIALLVACSSMADVVAIDNDGLGGVDYAYSIGRTEVSFTEWQQSGISGGNVGSGTNATLSPVVNISWHQAAQYANYRTSGNVNTGAYTFAAGKVSTITAHDSAAMDALVSEHTTVYVLPTEAEWRKAAYWTGSAFSLYANGTSTVPVDETDAVYGRSIGDGSWTVGEGTPEQNGTLNMMGSVWEWMESTYGGEAYNAADDSQQMAFRGGDYFLGSGFLQETTRATDDRGTSFNIGIRLVAIPEPGTISLMSLSTLSLFITRSVRRRRRVGGSLIPVRRAPLCDAFSSEAEWRALNVDEEEKDWISQITESVKLMVVSSWNSCKEVVGSFDKAFWNGIVVCLEKIQRRRAAAPVDGVNKALETVDKTFWNGIVIFLEKIQGLRASAKKRFVSGLDAFLAVIMK